MRKPSPGLMTPVGASGSAAYRPLPLAPSAAVWTDLVEQLLEAGGAQTSDGTRGELLDAEQVDLVLADELDDLLGVRAAEQQVRGHHGEALSIGGLGRAAAAKRARDDDRDERDGSHGRQPQGGANTQQRDHADGDHREPAT